MKNKELFDRTISILVKAYQNDTLQHENCYACAVGNLVAGNNNYHYEAGDRGLKWCGVPDWYLPKHEVNEINNENWITVVCTEFGKQSVNQENYTGEAKRQIDSTGYSFDNVAKIEKTFEKAKRGKNEEEWMFNGLIAVYDVLCEIHEVNKEDVEKGEEVFVKC